LLVKLAEGWDSNHGTVTRCHVFLERWSVPDKTKIEEDHKEHEMGNRA
jgi:hypothetical protein